MALLPEFTCISKTAGCNGAGANGLIAGDKNNGL